MKAKKGKARVVLAGDAPSAPINSAFARLADKLPQAQSLARAEDVRDVPPIPQSQSLDAQLDAALQRLAKPHVFKSKKGRGGKTVTQIDHRGCIDVLLLDLLCKRLCRRLGCGGCVQGADVILQGDQIAGAHDFFAAAR